MFWYYSKSIKSNCSSFAMSLAAFFPIKESKCSANILPVPGLFTQIFSLVIFSPFLIAAIEQTVAKAKSIVTC